MKGVVFNLLEETVHRAHGPDVWDALIESAGVSGAYTSLGSYPDSEVEALIAAAMQALALDRNEVLRWFGQSAVPVLAERYPAFFDGPASAREFTAGVNTIIHAEVRKLYPGAICPHFRLSDREDGRLVMDYLSIRRMCALAQGLVEGAAAWYGEVVEIDHVACTQRGDPHCSFLIRWSPAPDRELAFA